MSQKAAIAVWVSDSKQKLVRGLKGSTTVQDVIKVLIPGATPDSHGLFETWCDSQEQMLRPRSKILRLLQAWSSEDLRHVRFFIRELGSSSGSGSGSLLAGSGFGVSTELRSDISTSSQWSSCSSLQQNTIDQYSMTRDTYRESIRRTETSRDCSDPVRRSGSVGSNNSVKHGHGGSSSSINSVGSTGSVDSRGSGGTYTSQRSSKYHRTSLRQSRSNASTCSDNPDESSVEKLLRLMKEQDLKLSQQMAQIRKIETEIEAIETQNHMSRIQKDGFNYIQHGYMIPKDQDSPLKSIPEPELCRRMSPKKLRQDISVLEREILEEQAHITKEIAEQAQEIRAMDSMDSDIMEEIRELKDAVRNSIQISMAQEQEMSQMNDALQGMQSEMESKAQCILELVSELNEEETEDKAELTEYSMLLQHRLGANTNLVENILQRYRANIQNIEGHMYDENDHSGSDSGVSSQEPESLENSSDDSQDYEKLNSTVSASTTSLSSVSKSKRSSTDSSGCGEESEHKSSCKDVTGEGYSKSESGLKSQLNDIPRAPLASLDSTLLSSGSSGHQSVGESGDSGDSGQGGRGSGQDLSVLSDTAINKPAHQISIIQQNLTLTNETLPNDTLQPLDVLVTTRTVVTSTPEPQKRPTPQARPPTPPPPPQPQRRVAFADHDSIREITMYSMDETTLVEDGARYENDEEDEEDEEDDTIVEHHDQYYQCQGEMPADRFVVSLHPQPMSQPESSENMSYQQAIYNYSPTDASQTNFLLAGPTSRLHRKMKAQSKPKSAEMRHKLLDKLLLLPKLAKRSKSVRAPKLCTFIEDTFEDSYRYALTGHRSDKPLTPLRHSVSQNDVTREENNDVTLLRSYTVGDLGRIGYSWIYDDNRELADKENAPPGSHKASLETLV